MRSSLQIHVINDEILVGINEISFFWVSVYSVLCIAVMWCNKLLYTNVDVFFLIEVYKYTDMCDMCTHNYK